MRTSPGRVRDVRSLFVSDLHLGCRHAHAAEFLDFLSLWRPERLFLVGDVIDGWKLRRSLAWQQIYNDILARLFELADRGTEIIYTPGNHDAFLRQFAWNFPFIRMVDEEVIELEDGRTFLVTHGDRFDVVECTAGWVSVAASVGYDALLSANRWCSWYRRQPRAGTYAFSGRVKRHVKQLVRYISDFEHRLAAHARERGCDGVICGHIHTPLVSEIEGVTYVNTGDWVENCTAVVETMTGELELVHYFEQSPVAEPCAALAVPDRDPLTPVLAGSLSSRRPVRPMVPR
jgi:UDP-2,3-diacylglucosamine pyrophosphatase LpxH